MKTSLRQALAAIGLALALPALAAYPDRPITMVVPTAAGGGSDTLARIVGEKLTEMWNQPVVIDIRPGASGTIGGDHVARARPDGYTLLMITNLHASTAVLMRKLPYDAIQGFEPVASVGSTPMVLEVHPGTPAADLKQLVELARKAPGKVSFGSAGAGSPSQLAGEILSASSKTDMVHVPYKGAGQATSDLLGNHVTYVFSNPMSTLNLVKTGQLKAIAVSSPKRMAVLPDVPTVAESGYPGFAVSTWWGILAPKGTPTAVLDQVHAAINKILAMPEVQKRFAEMGLDTDSTSRAAFGKFINGEIGVWKKLAAERNLQAE